MSLKKTFLNSLLISLLFGLIGEVLATDISRD
jgi:hypothetical protein